MVALLVFIIATLKMVFGEKKKKVLNEKGPFGDNVIKNPAGVATEWAGRGFGCAVVVCLFRTNE